MGCHLRLRINGANKFEVGSLRANINISASLHRDQLAINLVDDVIHKFPGGQ